MWSVPSSRSKIKDLLLSAIRTRWDSGGNLRPSSTAEIRGRHQVEISKAIV